MATTMPDGVAGSSLLRLMAWLSPAFPVGGYAYSHGLEAAFGEAAFNGRDGLEAWIADLLTSGSAWNDAILFAESSRRARDGGDLVELAELAEALSGSLERHMESQLQGAAFIDASRNWPTPVHSDLPADCAYCVAAGAIAGAHNVPIESALQAYLQAFASNLIQAAIRLGVTGQQGAAATIASLEPVVIETAARAKGSTLDDLGSCTVISDVMAMRHEVRYSRIFRS